MCRIPQLPSRSFSFTFTQDSRWNSHVSGNLSGRRTCFVVIVSAIDIVIVSAIRRTNAMDEDQEISSSTHTDQELGAVASRKVQTQRAQDRLLELQWPSRQGVQTLTAGRDQERNQG
jgi:hypothetical protein